VILLAFAIVVTAAVLGADPSWVIVSVFPLAAIAFFVIPPIGRRLVANSREPEPADQQTVDAWAEEHGWTFTATGPPPTPEVVEAVFRAAPGRPLLAQRSTNIVRGHFGAWDFASYRIEGSEAGSNLTPVPASARVENVVSVPLPGLVPELRLLDRRASFYGDFGLALPNVPTGDRRIDSRWRVQTRFATFVPDLFDATVREFLASVPDVPCTIVFRMGELLSTRDAYGTPSTITTRLELLTGLADRIPTRVYGRATPEEAGRGAYRLVATTNTINGWSAQREVRERNL
jgi:hypothetical protein